MKKWMIAAAIVAIGAAGAKFVLYPDDDPGPPAVASP